MICTTLFVGIPIVLYLTYRWLTSDHDYFKKIGVNYDKPHVLVGNMLPMVLQKESILIITQRIYKKYKNAKIFGFFNFLQPTYVLTDPEIIKKITVKDFDSFLNHNPIFEMDDLFSRTIFVMRDKRWRDMRTTLSPIFTSSKMKMMFSLLSDHSKDFIKYLSERSKRGQNNDVDVEDIFSRYTADGISTAALGFVGDSVRNEQSKVYSIVKQMQKDFDGTVGAMKFLLSFTLPKIYKFFDFQITSESVYEFFRHVVLDVMDDREKKNITRPDVIQLLLQARKGQLQNDENSMEKDHENFSAHTEFDVSLKNEKLSNFEDKDWIAQGFIFFGAGFDTSTVTLKMTTYELAKNPDVQQELIAEIDEVLAGGKPVTYETLHKMKFMDMVVSETLRKWPPAGQIDRCCNKDYLLDLDNGKTVQIKKGEIIFLPVHNIQNDPAYFPNPEKFDPHRFSDENKSSIVSGTYIPFGSGPRICKKF